LFIFYTYASVAKLYPDWLDTTVVEQLMHGKKNYIIVGELLQHKTVHYFLAYGGILFDGLIIPLLLFKPTRKYMFFISLFFHLFNSVVFQIGIFPFLSLAFSLFFFEPEMIRNIFLKKKPFYNEGAVILPKNKNILVALFSIYFIIQISLPLRQYYFEDNVLWTEEGHRLSWRMMLRIKSGRTAYIIENKETGRRNVVKLDDYLTIKQKHSASTKPDVMWQFAQYLKAEYKNKGEDIAVYVNSKVRVNGRQYKRFINPKVDLANVEWQALKHSDWILPSDLNYK
jgi:hypothetical protein